MSLCRKPIATITAVKFAIGQIIGLGVSLAGSVCMVRDGVGSWGGHWQAQYAW